MVMGIVYWTLMIGFITGAVAKIFVKQLKQGDIFMTMTAGLFGSVFFGWLGSLLKFYEYGEPHSLIASVIGAVIAVIFYCLYFIKKSRI